MRRVLAAVLVLAAALIVQELNQRPEPVWLVETTPLHKGHAPNVPDGVVCVEQKFEDAVNVGAEKVVRVTDIGRYKPGDPCPPG